MEQNQNTQQSDMQGQKYYQYGHGQAEQNQVQQFDKPNTYKPYGQDMQSTNHQYNPYGQEYQQPSYSPVAVKKRVNPAAIIVPIAILIAAAVVVLIVLLSGKGGYKGAEEKYFSQMFGGLSSALSETEKVGKEPQAVTVNFEVSNAQITDYIGLSDVTFTAETAVKGEDIYTLLSFADGDRTYNGKFWFDGEKDNVLMLLPDISSIYLQASVQETTADNEKAMAALSDIFSQTLETYFELVGDTKVESGQELTLNGVAYKADKVEIKLDKVQIATVAKTFLENLVSNDNAMDILCAYYGADKEEVIETLDINYAIEEFEEIIEEGDGSDGSFEMTVWMQGGSIIGRDIVITSYSDTGKLSFYQIPVSEGCITYFEILPDDFRYLNEDKVNGELHSGTLTLYYGNEEVTVEYEDVAVTDKLFQGKAKIIAAGSEAFEVTMELEKEGDTKTALISVPNIFKVTVTIEPSVLSYEDIPQPSEGEVVIINSDGSFNEDDEAYDQLLNDFFEFFMSYLDY